MLQGPLLERVQNSNEVSDKVSDKVGLRLTYAARRPHACIAQHSIATLDRFCYLATMLASLLTYLTLARILIEAYPWAIPLFLFQVWMFVDAVRREEWLWAVFIFVMLLIALW